jgi:uncharacterized membrane protein HdeD (DUF308 family)
MPEEDKKKISKNTVILISGIIWIALGLFGMLFDPDKTIIITAQLVLGVFIILYYLFNRKSG